MTVDDNSYDCRAASSLRMDANAKCAFCVLLCWYIFCVAMGSSGEIIARLVCVCVYGISSPSL